MYNWVNGGGGLVEIIYLFFVELFCFYLHLNIYILILIIS